MNIAMRRAKLLILECASENKEKMSEGLLLWELMRILGYEKRTNLKMISGPNRLIEELENAEGRYIHISAHGDVHQTRGTYLKTPRKGKVYSSDLSGMWANRKKSEIPSLVVLSACEAGHIDMVREKSSPWIAFKNTMIGLSQSLPKLSGAWSFYEWGEKCFI